LGGLASQLEAITRRVRTAGLARVADDLTKVATALRRLQQAQVQTTARAEGENRAAVSRNHGP
jgi:hypothetical protein